MGCVIVLLFVSLHFPRFEYTGIPTRSPPSSFPFVLSLETAYPFLIRTRALPKLEGAPG